MHALPLESPAERSVYGLQQFRQTSSDSQGRLFDFYDEVVKWTCIWGA